MNSRCLTTWTILLSCAISHQAAWTAEPPRTIRPNPEFGSSSAVITSARQLVQTTQIQPLDGQGTLVGPGDIAKQLNQTFVNLEGVLKESGSRLNLVVKLNFYVTRDDLVADVRKFLARRFQTPALPAVSFVTTRLPNAQALVAVDAIAIHEESAPASDKPVATRQLSSTIIRTQTLHYVSGQAEKGATLGEATRKTLLSLEASLKFCRRSKSDVRQIKCFLTPMSQVAEVRLELEAFYPDQPVPPVAFVEWQSTLPIEIEVLAVGAPDGALEPPGKLVYLTPPGMTASPVFSRICRVHDTPLIFVSGLYGEAGTNGMRQVETIFSELNDILKESGSDLEHLVKATYYVSQDEASQKLNELRPKYYAPQSPPSASKAQVTGVGKTGTGLTLDMIAVPK